MTFLWIILVLLFLWAVVQPWVPNTFVAVLLLFVIWTTGTLYYDAVVALRLLDHCRTTAYTEVQADVLASQDGHRQINRAHTFNPQIAYAYTAEGKRYTNSVIQSGGFGSLESAEDIYYFVKDRPAGAKTAAYVNPKDPADSVLIHGIPGIEVFFLLCLLPFNMFSIVSLTYLIHSWQMARTKSPTAGFRTEETPTRFRIELPPRNALWYDFICYVAGMSLGGIAFCGVYMLFKPLTPDLVLKAFGMVVLVAAGLTAYRAWLYSKGRFDMEADLEAGTLKVPVLRGRQERKVLALKDCDAVKVRVVDRDPDAATTPRPATESGVSVSGKPKSKALKAREKAAAKAAAKTNPPKAKAAEVNYRLEVLMKSAPDAKDDERDRTFITELEDKEPAIRFATWLAGKLKLRKLNSAG